MSIEAMKQALEALTYIYTETTEYEEKVMDEAIAVLEQAIAEAEDAVAAEREACAKLCENIAEEFAYEPHDPDPMYCAEAIRKRGEK